MIDNVYDRPVQQCLDYLKSQYPNYLHLSNFEIGGILLGWTKLSAELTVRELRLVVKRVLLDIGRLMDEEREP